MGSPETVVSAEEVHDWGLIDEGAIEVFDDEDLAALTEGIDENGIAL